jgi:hypothetical protein
MAKDKNTKNTKKRKQRKINESIKIILTDTPDDAEEEEDDGEMGGIYWDKADMKLIYHALRHYKPTDEEKQLWDILCEEFEEILVCDYGEKLPEGK